MKKPFRSHLYQGPPLHKRNIPVKGYFEGWYFKHAASSGRVISFIPGVSLSDDPHAFIQINDSLLGSDYLRFPLEEADLIPSGKHSNGDLTLRIGASVFSDSGIHADMETKYGRLNGNLEYKSLKKLPGTLYRPGIMGPFSYIPGMECYHGLVSMDHSVSGSLSVGDETVSFEKANGYIEKDFGTSFPRSWIWMQANSFPSGASVMLSQAVIPWGRSSFPGHLGFLYHPVFAKKGEVFATYSSWRLKTITLSNNHGLQKLEAVIGNKRKRLVITGEFSEAHELIAPVSGDMNRKLKETVQGRIDIAYEEGGELLFSDSSQCAGIEVQGRVL